MKPKSLSVFNNKLKNDLEEYEFVLSKFPDAVIYHYNNDLEWKTGFRSKSVNLNFTNYEFDDHPLYLRVKFWHELIFNNKIIIVTAFPESSNLIKNDKNKYELKFSTFFNSRKVAMSNKNFFNDCRVRILNIINNSNVKLNINSKIKEMFGL